MLAHMQLLELLSSIIRLMLKQINNDLICRERGPLVSDMNAFQFSTNLQIFSFVLLGLLLGLQGNLFGLKQLLLHPTDLRFGLVSKNVSIDSIVTCLLLFILGFS